MLWEPQKENSLPHIWTSNPKPQIIQWGQDINSVGNLGNQITWPGQVIIEYSGRACDYGLIVVQLL